MRIAILTQYYPPESGAPQNRLSDLAKRLLSFGHQVEVLTGLPNYPDGVIQPAYLGRENTVEVLDGVRVARVGLYASKERSTLGRLRGTLTFAANVVRHGPKLLSRCDVLLMESPPPFIALGGVPLARLLGAKLVCNVADLWPDTLVELGLLRKGAPYYAMQQLERWMYTSSSLITAQTQGIVESIQRRFPGKQVKWFPNGVDLSLYQGKLERDALREEFGWKDRFVVGYAGVYGHWQALDQVLDAALLLREMPRIHFALFGNGPVKEHLEQRIANERIDNVRIYPRQPRERMPHLQAAMDAGLVPMANRKVTEGARPSKMFEVMAAGRPLVLCLRGESLEVLHGHKQGPCGVAVAPEAPAELAEKLRWLAERPEECEEMGVRGREVARTSYDREQIARRIETLLQSQASTAPQRSGRLWMRAPSGR